MANLGDIQNLIAELKNRYDSVDTRRSHWNDHFRVLEEWLNSCAKELTAKGIIAFVSKDKRTDNWQSIYLVLSQKPSGIGQFVKNNCALGYSQTAKGNVLVWMDFPFIEELEEELPKETIALLSPYQLSEPELKDHFIKFIKGLIEYEKEGIEKIRQIGFKKHEYNNG